MTEVSRHRTPSVPGEDMRGIALKWLREHGMYIGWDNHLAALLSSTAALAREEERERCWQIADEETRNWGGQDPQVAAANIANKIARAIGKEG